MYQASPFSIEPSPLFPSFPPYKLLMWSDIIDNDLEAPKDYARLKQQNAKLRNELKVINDCLSKQVERKKESHKT